jgi:hypothetical protein
MKPDGKSELPIPSAKVTRMRPLELATGSMKSGSENGLSLLMFALPGSEVSTMPILSHNTPATGLTAQDLTFQTESLLTSTEPLISLVHSVLMNQLMFVSKRVNAHPTPVINPMITLEPLPSALSKLMMST